MPYDAIWGTLASTGHTQGATHSCMLTCPVRPPCSGKSLETLVKMGVRLGCHPDSPHLLSPSFNAHTIAELQSQTQHLAPLHQAMAGAHITDSPGATQGALEGHHSMYSMSA